MATKTEVFSEYVSAYLKAVREEKSAILRHVCFVTRLHRKAAIRKFRKLQLKDSARQERRGRHVCYGPEATAALRDVWEAGNEVCGELLHPMIREYVAIMERGAVAASVKERLRNEHVALNPLILKHEIDKRPETLYAVQKRYGNPR